jgi:hypothetical protein
MWVLPIARSSLVELICRREGRVEEEASSCKQASRQAGRQAGRERVDFETVGNFALKILVVLEEECVCILTVAQETKNGNSDKVLI